MKCLSCAGTLDRDWLFCPGCGSPVGHDRPFLMRLTDSQIDEIFERMKQVKNSFSLERPSASFNQAAAKSYGRDGMTQRPAGEDPIGSGVRGQVFEVIVRQAITGAPWKAICKGPMIVNQISEEEVEEEVKRRLGGDDRDDALVSKKPSPEPGSGSVALQMPEPSLSHAVEDMLMDFVQLAESTDLDQLEFHSRLKRLLVELRKLPDSIRQLEGGFASSNAQQALQEDLMRELMRVKEEFKRSGGDLSPGS